MWHVQLAWILMNKTKMGTLAKRVEFGKLEQISHACIFVCFRTLFVIM